MAGSKDVSKDVFPKEYSYHQRMKAESWRKRGLSISSICRCERATPCFDHMVFLADLRTAAQDKLDAGDTTKAQAMFLDATEFYLKLTDIPEGERPE